MTQVVPPPFIVGILLAAGFSRRFGQQDKLLYPLAHGLSVAETAGQALLAALPNAIAVVRQENVTLQMDLARLGYTVIRCEAGDINMADSLRAGVLAAQANFPGASGYVIALADMPFIRPDTIREIAHQLKHAAIVQPTVNSQRGHPVGFSSRFSNELIAIQGDQGAREVLQAHQNEVLLLPCQDDGILRDIDTLADLAD